MATSLSKRPKPKDFGKDKEDKDDKDKKKSKPQKPTDPLEDPQKAYEELMEKFQPGPDGEMTPEQEELIKRFMEQQEDPEFKEKQKERIFEYEEKVKKELEEKKAKDAAEKEAMERAAQEAFGTEEGDEDEDEDVHSEL